uniref:Dedicator of cytokinesis C/D N-terminal domain-containing protein n=1 Tax=Hippocampus comes TaxID=109280 RepID=A0A3Q2XK05_HIPCM
MASESTRRFTKNLLKPGSAAEIRQTACNAVRHSAVAVSNKSRCELSHQEKPKLIDPLDYEAVISELGAELKQDPLRELLLFPDNDFTVSVCRRTLRSAVPEGAELQAECLLVRQACKYYNSDLNVVQFKYDDYAGDYRLLPRYCEYEPDIP